MVFSVLGLVGDHRPLVASWKYRIKLFCIFSNFNLYNVNRFFFFLLSHGINMCTWWYSTHLLVTVAVVTLNHEAEVYCARNPRLVNNLLWSGDASERRRREGSGEGRSRTAAGYLHDCRRSERGLQPRGGPRDGAHFVVNWGWGGRCSSRFWKGFEMHYRSRIPPVWTPEEVTVGFYGVEFGITSQLPPRRWRIHDDFPTKKDSCQVPCVIIVSPSTYPSK